MLGASILILVNEFSLSLRTKDSINDSDRTGLD